MLNNLPLSDINNWTENIYGDYVFRFNKFMTYEIKNIDETNYLYLIIYKRKKGIDSLRRECLYRNNDLSKCMLICTTQPCSHCLKSIMAYGITKVYYHFGRFFF